MTAPTPPLVDVIAAALVEHSGDRTQPHFWLCCGCGADWPVDGPYVSDITATHAAHQARAVLAAIEQAGSVQYGVKGEGRVKEYGRDRRRAQLAARGRGAAFISRLTLPWTAVE